ncbi:MAG: bifunctional phosphopantothenoylcysteine decarboxylase/phosphopantothenate synthase [Pseudomonadota bacterium]|jgi:phosphopantothenoylcysteine decarboxylase / phosphopantothenate---cysteine ligase|nr:bifunctional phosphopantothenoylcysteine decarboxylase/phosphopantothenate synthase [Pseudomonadota bacterium]
MRAPRILLVIGGGIAAYKSCELVRLIRKAGGSVTCVLTEGGAQFVTPMALAALSESKVYTSLFDLKDEVEMGHIQLSREADLIVVCPATANMMAKMAAGIADDLATTLILATDKPVLAVPAMNVRMWEHAATQRNAEWLRQAGVTVVDPDEGPMACGEFGPGRLPEPPAIMEAIAAQLGWELDLPDPAAPAIASPGRGGEWLDESEDEAEAESGPLASRGGGLGSLLSAIIPRSTPRKSHEELESELDALPDLDEAMPDDSLEFAAADPAPRAGPLLATKGKAAAAPPTDREAINHEVGAQRTPIPEPDPLDGQAEFDTDPDHRPLFGRHVLVTAGPTHEAIDPVRYIANRSSGKQGFAIAAMAAAAGARVTLVAGPVHLPTPLGVDRVDVESADEMAEAVQSALPADAAFMVAAVADWKARLPAGQKIKKSGSAPPPLELAENPDILAGLARSEQRPGLLIGFAAETQDVLDNAKAKRARKGADWIVANDVADTGEGSVMGGDRNRVHILTDAGVETLEDMPKQDVARELVRRAARALEDAND